MIAPPRGVCLTNDDGPPSKHAPHLLAFTQSVKQWLLEYHQQHQSTLQQSSNQSDIPSVQAPKAFVCTPHTNQSWVGKAVTYGRIKAHTNWNAENDNQTIHQANIQTDSQISSDISQPITSTIHSTEQSHSVDERASVMFPGPNISLWSSVEASPSSTANIGLHCLAPFGVDLVISGPNWGRNTGRSFILSSGTVGAALEGAFAGKKSIAVSFAYFCSLEDVTEDDVRNACHLATKVIDRLWKNWPSDNSVELFNVNIPMGAAMNADIMMTHVLQDSYQSIYQPFNYLCKDPSTESNNGVDVLPDQAKLAEARDLSDNVSNNQTANHTNPQLTANQSDDPTPMTHEVEFNFNVKMFRDWSSINQFQGSDYWAVKNGHVSVTPLRCSLIEGVVSEHNLFPRYKPSAL